MAVTAPRRTTNGRGGGAGGGRPGATTGSTPAPAPVASVGPVRFDHEQLAVRRGDRSGVEAIVAVHSTRLGPALGGVRMWSYAETEDAIRDALRLAAGMTLKAAAAGLHLGGGKGVIRLPPGAAPAGELRRAALLDFGDLVASLGGRYITAEDAGVGPGDLAAIAERTEHVTGLPAERGGSGDPSPLTALGVEAAMRACCEAAFGDRDLRGRRIAVVGIGHVGGDLARRLARAGAELVVSDIRADRRELARELGARWVDPEEAMAVECDVLSPCALGGAVDAGNVGVLAAPVICGSANNQLADEALADQLAGRGILYAPDFIVNAGGLINVYREIRGYSSERALELAAGIESTAAAVIRAAAARGTTPLAAARELARTRLEGPVAAAA